MALQETVRDIDAGKTAKFLKIGMISVIVIGITMLYFLVQFKGLGTEAAMDQAQIARSLVSNEGFSTRYIRPLAIRILSDLHKPTDVAHFPEFYNSPLMPMLEAVALLPVKSYLEMTATQTLSVGDRAIAILEIVLLFLGLGVWYLVAWELFDQSVALLTVGLLLITDLLWQFALAGLSQPLLIVIFGLINLCSLKAKKADEEEGGIIKSLIWLGLAALGFGLLTLTQGVTAFLLPGYLVFVLFAFRARIWAFLITISLYLLTVSPWLIHNFLVCHNPLGLSLYEALAGAGITQEEIFRGVDTGLVVGGGMATKFKTSFIDQEAHLWEYLGLNLAAVFFLPSLLHLFRNPVASIWRWIVVLMWVGGACGMAAFGVKGAVSPNQLHVIFLPIFVIFGMAFLLVLWQRLNITAPAFRVIFLCVVFLASGVPMIVTLLAGQQARIQWPPYVPPVIALFSNWFGPQEIIASDMPWGVAWYANRKSLLLPVTVRSMNEISDYNTLGSPIVGLYLTTISGEEKFVDLVKGKYKDWGPVIMRTVNMNDFLFKSFTPLPLDGECILYADTDRWARRTAQ